MVKYQCNECQFGCTLETSYKLDKLSHAKLQRCPIFKPIHGEEVKADFKEMRS